MSFEEIWAAWCSMKLENSTEYDHFNVHIFKKQNKYLYLPYEEAIKLDSTKGEYLGLISSRNNLKTFSFFSGNNSLTGVSFETIRDRYFK